MSDEDLPGFSGVLQTVLPNFAYISNPLSEVTGRNAPNRVKWTEKSELAFTTLKQALCSEPVLHIPDFSKLFVFQIDAS